MLQRFHFFVQKMKEKHKDKITNIILFLIIKIGLYPTYIFIYKI